MTKPKTRRLRIPIGRGLELYVPKSRVRPQKPKRRDVVWTLDLSKFKPAVYGVKLRGGPKLRPTKARRKKRARA